MRLTGRLYQRQCSGKARCLVYMLSIVWIMLLAAHVNAANGIATVKDYGAVGDGFTDDSGAFQAALSAAGIVHVPAGRYRVTAQIQVPADGALMGEGTIVVDWDPAGPGNAEGGAAIRVMGDNAAIKGIRIEKVFTDGSYGTGILATGCVNTQLRDVAISRYSARYGIHLVECSDFQIAGCLISDFKVDTASDMVGDSPAGIRLTRSARGMVQYCILKRIEVGPAGRASLSPTHPAYGPQGYQSDHVAIVQSRDIAINGNTMLTSGEGINMQGSQNCTLYGNVIQDIYLAGIRMTGTSFCAIGENKIADSYHGIVFDDGTSGTKSFGNVFHGNMIRDTGAPGSFGVPGAERITTQTPAGVTLSGGSDWNAVTENVVLDTQVVKTQADGIRPNSSANNLVTDNISSNNLTYQSLTPFEETGNTSVEKWNLY